MQSQLKQSSFLDACVLSLRLLNAENDCSQDTLATGIVKKIVRILSGFPEFAQRCRLFTVYGFIILLLTASPTVWILSHTLLQESSVCTFLIDSFALFTSVHASPTLHSFACNILVTSAIKAKMTALLLGSPLLWSAICLSVLSTEEY